MSDGDETEQQGLVPFAAHSGQQFTQPWVRRVRDVDDHVLAGLLKTLVNLRRIKIGATAVAAVAGALVFGVLHVDNPFYTALIYATLAGFVGMPVFAGGTLAVRRLFLREAQTQGLARSTSTLILTRAERRARFLPPWTPEEERMDLLLQAVREPDTP
ncbi:MAG TPA: hypothetical protein VGO62_09800 [Myxococcota bacterium]